MSCVFTFLQALAQLVTAKDLAEGRLYPPLSSIGDVSFKLAVKVRAQCTHNKEQMYLDMSVRVQLYGCGDCKHFNFPKPVHYRSWSMPMSTTWRHSARSRPTKKHMCTQSPTALTMMSLLWTRTAGQTTV